MHRLKEFNEREFEKAVVVIVDVWYFESEELIPYLHPRMLLILKSKSSKKSKEGKKKNKKKKKNSSEEESEEEIITKKQKKGKGKKKWQNTSESDNESKQITIYKVLLWFICSPSILQSNCSYISINKSKFKV